MTSSFSPPTEIFVVYIFTVVNYLSVKTTKISRYMVSDRHECANTHNCLVFSYNTTSTIIIVQHCTIMHIALAPIPIQSDKHMLMSAKSHQAKYNLIKEKNYFRPSCSKRFTHSGVLSVEKKQSGSSWYVKFNVAISPEQSLLVEICKSKSKTLLTMFLVGGGREGWV